MPTNFQNASNSLQNRLAEQYQTPGIAPPMAPVVPNVATPELPPQAAPPAQANWQDRVQDFRPNPATPEIPRPVPIDRSQIVPVDRGPGQIDLTREQRQSDRFGNRMERLSDKFDFPLPPNFGAEGVVPVDRGQMRAWIDSLRQNMSAGRKAAVQRVLSNPRGRKAAAAVGGAVLGRARTAGNPEAQAQAQALAVQAAQAKVAAQAKIEAAQAAMPQAPVSRPLPVAPAAPAMSPQQRLQEFISERALPGRLATGGLLGRR